MIENKLIISKEHTEPNQSINLGRFKARLCCENFKENLELNAFYRPLPSPDLIWETSIIYGETKSRSIMNKADLGQALSIEFVDYDFSCEFKILSKTLNMTNGVITESRFKMYSLTPVFLKKKDCEVTELVFKVINFPQVRFQEKNEFRVFLSESGNVRFDDFLVRIEPCDNLIKTVQYLQGSGGYGFTYYCKVKPVISEALSNDEILSILDTFYYLFSLCAGYWVAPFIPAGLDKKGELVWSQLGIRDVSEWKPVLSWCDLHNFQSLLYLLPIFHNTIHDKIMGEILKNVIYWYVFSNTAKNRDASIITSQVALEKITWFYLLQVRQSLTKEKLAKKNAVEQLRKLLLEVGITTQIPPIFSELVRFSKQNDFDAPETFIEIRHYLVHSKGKEPGFDYSKLITEASELGLWYLELCLLKILGYSGTYSSRVEKKCKWKGEIIPVPWARLSNSNSVER